MRHLQREVNRLTRDVLGLSALVEETLRDAFRAIERRDAPAARRVIVRRPTSSGDRSTANVTPGTRNLLQGPGIRRAIPSGAPKRRFEPPSGPDLGGIFRVLAL